MSGWSGLPLARYNTCVLTQRLLRVHWSRERCHCSGQADCNRVHCGAGMAVLIDPGTSLSVA